MDIPHDGSLIGRIEYEIVKLESRIEVACSVKEAADDIRRTLAVLRDARRSIRESVINEVLRELEHQEPMR